MVKNVKIKKFQLEDIMIIVEMLEKSFELFINRKDIKEIISWIIINGASFERWIQFEYGYYLHEIIKDKGIYYIYPEKGGTDIPVYNIEKDNIAYNIEVKTIANWYTYKEQYSRINDDILKINANDNLGCVLVFYLYAIPYKDNKLTKWIDEKISNEKVLKNKNVFKDEKEFMDNLNYKVGCFIEKENLPFNKNVLKKKIKFSDSYFENVEMGIMCIMKKAKYSWY